MESECRIKFTLNNSGHWGRKARVKKTRGTAHSTRGVSSLPAWNKNSQKWVRREWWAAQRRCDQTAGSKKAPAKGSMSGQSLRSGEKRFNNTKQETEQETPNDGGKRPHGYQRAGVWKNNWRSSGDQLQRWCTHAPLPVLTPADGPVVAPANIAVRHPETADALRALQFITFVAGEMHSGASPAV